MIRRDDAAVAACAAVLSVLALLWFRHSNQLLLYGDAVAHLHIARRVFDTKYPAIANLGSVWLPLPHLLLLPFVMVSRWWQSGFAGAVPSMASYVAAVVALFRLALFWLPRRWAALAAAVFAVNPGLLYMQTTAMTEPLFLALMLWAIVWVAGCICAVNNGDDERAARALLKAGVALACAMLTRYDGWILTALCGIALLACCGRRVFVSRSSRLRAAGIIFVVLVVAAPLAWLWFNARYFHDPLDFLRGPYSAKAIEARTAIPGHAPHPGYHRPWIALRYYLRASTLGAAAGVAGNAIALMLAGCGTILLWRRHALLRASMLLLWFPLAFYTYSVAYGSVPIFIPIWPPFSFYNTRYGMELLPAFALFPVAALAGLAKLRMGKTVYSASCALAAVNAIALALATPVVLQEARANSATRIPFEQALAAQIRQIPLDQSLLMYGSAYAGALQDAGRPLRDTIMEADYYEWNAALLDPAKAADYVLAVDGDPVAAAVSRNGEGLTQSGVVTCQGQPRAILYRSRKSPPR